MIMDTKATIHSECQLCRYTTRSALH